MEESKPFTLLNVDRLQAGDILLSRKKDRESWLIAWLGRSRYSHAQIVVRDELGGLSCYESTTDCTTSGKVVGLVREIMLMEYVYRIHEFVREPDGRSALVVAKDISDYVEFDVLRWCKADDPTFRKFRRSVKAECLKLHLTPYASPEAVAALTRFPKLLGLLARVTGVVPTHALQGMVCSQLVAKVYSDAGVPLVSPQPQQVAPRDLEELIGASGSPVFRVPREDWIFEPTNEYFVSNDFRGANERVILYTNDAAEIYQTSKTMFEVTRGFIEEQLDKLLRRV